MAKGFGFNKRGSSGEPSIDEILNTNVIGAGSLDGGPDDFGDFGGFDDFDDDFGAPLAPPAGGFKRRAAQPEGRPAPNTSAMPDVADVLPPTAPRKARVSPARRAAPAPVPEDDFADMPPAPKPARRAPQKVDEDDFVSMPSAPMPSRNAAPQASDFGAVNQKNYGTVPSEVVSVDGEKNLFGKMKDKIAAVIPGATPQDDGDYYTPPEGFAATRARYKTRNHRPMPVIIKTALLGAGILFAIFVLVKVIFFGMMISRVDFVDPTEHAPVRLTLDEAEAMQAQLSEEDNNDITLPKLTAQTNKDIQLVLLVGTSNAIGSNKAGECDSIVLVAFDHVHKKIKLTSIARELYAQIPEYKNNMIGEAFFYDSGSGNRALDVLRESIELNLCVEIDNIVSIDYDALQVIVNKLGGITMNITDEEAAYMRGDAKYGLFPRYTAGGLYDLTGAEMLNYLRMKNIGEKNDFERTQRLRNVLDITFKQVGDLPAVKRMAAVYSVMPYITTDMSSYEVYKLVGHVGRMSKYELHGMSLPVNGSWDYDNVEINGEKTRVVVANYSFNAEYLQKFIYGDDLTYTYGNSVTGVDVPYISEEAKAEALAAANAAEQN